MVKETKPAAEPSGTRSEKSATRKSSGTLSRIEFQTFEHKFQDLVPSRELEVT